LSSLDPVPHPCPFPSTCVSPYLRSLSFSLHPPPPPPLFPYTTLFRSLLVNCRTVLRRRRRKASLYFVAIRLPVLAHLVVHAQARSEEHTSELQSHLNLVCRLLLEKKKERNRLKEDNRREHRKSCRDRL